MNKWFLVVLVVVNTVFVSCITNKDVVYLQDHRDENDTIPVLRELPKPYKVQVNDLLSINVKALDEELTKIFNPVETNNNNANGQNQSNLYFNGFTVDDHGKIKFPILGEITVLGYTTIEIEELVKKELLEQYFKETAELFVTVRLPGVTYTVTGEVNGTGIYTIFEDRVNIIDALANAGDVMLTANRKDILIVRQYPDGQRIHHIDLTDISAMNSPYYYIQPNDIILVKPLKRKVIGAGQTVIQNFAAIMSILAGITSIYVLTNSL
ncbi:polysaccharide biosynthesis/export family protein [Tamlana sp. 2_MG-2023]|uniref:polysaccharide biosynthesis/export family protein n=1 Tax=unclassified Tamlana TaxID=2614803 RepID=UPI0026E32B77|nr:MULTISPECIES: polysaccharide biosynthesis/export family protein [unclassified Tamlana]MDO6758733.1 polysaccharide biosynthesis/export family protein [Tamlana sp. 2_MG-2023]MDO6789432.1 polysaccharide biosynthesis/export family protein [Tamlana sp. 1_MG-2023]